MIVVKFGGTSLSGAERMVVIWYKEWAYCQTAKHMLFDKTTSSMLSFKGSFFSPQHIQKEERLGSYDTNHRLFNPVGIWHILSDR